MSTKQQAIDAVREELRKFNKNIESFIWDAKSGDQEKIDSMRWNLDDFGFFADATGLENLMSAMGVLISEVDPKD